MDDLKIAVVVPCHIQPTEVWMRALQIATDGKAEVIIVDDSPKQNLDFPNNWYVLNRQAQKEMLGDKGFVDAQQFWRSSACKNLGHYYAWKQEYDVIVGLDSDCVVPFGFLGYHIEGLKRQGYGWTNPIINTGWFPRGYPYAERMRKVIANLGLWRGVLDLGGKDRLMNGTEPIEPANDKPHAIAEGFIPFSGMNWAMLREAVPGMLFLPNFDYAPTSGNDAAGSVFKFRRVDDIWGGYIFQRFMEKRNERICYGDPIVEHVSDVDANADMLEETDSTMFENGFYTAVDHAMEQVEPGIYEDMTLQFYNVIKHEWKDTEWEPLIAAFLFWCMLFAGKYGDEGKA